jgi:protease-4
MLGQFGVASIPVKGGEMIDMGTPLRAMKEEERKHLQAIADQFHQHFVSHVQDKRPATKDSRVFDGRVVTGSQAEKLGLIDRVGYLDDALAAARRLAQLPDDSPVVMLRRNNDRAYTTLDITPNTPTMSSLIPLKVPGLDRSSLPTFLYLWQPEPVDQ